METSRWRWIKMHRWIWINELSLIHNEDGFFDILCIVWWLIIVLSLLIKWTNGWTPKWSPYGESSHGKTICGLSYPRRMVGGPMLVCGIMRWISMKLLVKLSKMDSLVIPFPVVCGMSHNSSRFETYGLTKLEDPHMKAWSP